MGRTDDETTKLEETTEELLFPVTPLILLSLSREPVQFLYRDAGGWPSLHLPNALRGRQLAGGLRDRGKGEEKRCSLPAKLLTPCRKARAVATETKKVRLSGYRASVSAHTPSCINFGRLFFCFVFSGEKNVPYACFMSPAET